MTLAPVSVILSHFVRARLRNRGAAGMILRRVSSVMLVQEVKLRTRSCSKRWVLGVIDEKAALVRLVRRVMLMSRIWGRDSKIEWMAVSVIRLQLVRSISIR